MAEHDLGVYGKATRWNGSPILQMSVWCEGGDIRKLTLVSDCDLFGRATDLVWRKTGTFDVRCL